LSTRRRIYLLRHAEVAYFDEHGQPVAPDEVPLTPTGRRQARRAGAALAGVRFDRVLPALERLLADPGWDTALAVLHGGVNRALLSFALSGRRLFLGAIEQAPACINVLDVDQAGGFVVRAVNATPWDPAYLAGRSTTMEELWAQYRGPQPA
jgi:broad specificity phosphatase PhoE